MLTSLTLSISLTLVFMPSYTFLVLQLFLPCDSSPLVDLAGTFLYGDDATHDNHNLPCPTRHPSRSETRLTNTGVAAASCSLVPINSARLADL